MISLLLLLLLPADIKARAQQNMTAMQNISALQVGGKRSYRVGVFNGTSRHAPIPHKGVYFGTEWYSLLQDSQGWTLVPEEDHFTYSTECWWSEIKRGSGEWADWVPCEGEVYVDSDANIVRIVQRLAPNRMVTTASMTMDYGWVQLKARRLVPLAITLSAIWNNHREETISARWVDYHEWGAESLVKDVDESMERKEARRVELREGSESVLTESRSDAGSDTTQAAISKPRTDDLIALPEEFTTESIKVNSKWRRLLKAVLFRWPH
jgi:hypothetical protein